MELFMWKQIHLNEYVYKNGYIFVCKITFKF